MPDGVQVIRTQRAVAHRQRAARVAVIDQHAEALADQGQRHAQLEPVAVRGRHPGAADTRLQARALAAVLAALDAPRDDRTRGGCGDEHLLLLALRVLEAKPHAIAEGRGLERVVPRGVEQRVLVVHLEQQVQHALVHAGQDGEAMARVLVEMAPGRRIVRPVIHVTVEERRGTQGHRLQIVGRCPVEVGIGRGGRCRSFRGAVRLPGICGRAFAVEQVSAPLERGGDGLRERVQGVDLALAQRRLHLARAGNRPTAAPAWRGQATAASGAATCGWLYSTQR